MYDFDWQSLVGDTYDAASAKAKELGLVYGGATSSFMPPDFSHSGWKVRFWNCENGEGRFSVSVFVAKRVGSARVGHIEVN